MTAWPAESEVLAPPEDWPGLAEAEVLLAAHLDAAVRVLGGEALGLIDLPPLSEGPVDAPQVRLTAVLLWARELEAAGLPRFVERLAEGVVRGRLLLPIRGAASRLMQYWRGRLERFTPEERQALYSRLFGGPGATDPNDAFAVSFEALIDTLDELGRAPTQGGKHHLLARIQVLGRDLAGALSGRAVGVTGFAARDIVAHIREALALLRDPELATALGGGSPWRILQQHGPSLLGAPVNAPRHLGRATAGLTVLRWLADVAGSLTGGHPAQPPGPVLAAAATWRTERGPV